MVSISSSVTREYMWHLQSLLLDDLAVEHPHDSVGLATDRDVVRDDEKGQSALEIQPAHERDDLGSVLRVEISGWLVRPNDCRVVDERPGDGHPLAFASRELVGHVARTV